MFILGVKSIEEGIYMNPLRELFYSIALKQEVHDWIIGELCLIQEKEKVSFPARFCIRKEKYVVLETAQEGMRLQMHLVCPGGKDSPGESIYFGKKLYTGKQNCVLLCEKSFSKEEIFLFVREIGDTNPLHQMDAPVVPGCLIAEWLWGAQGLTEDCLSQDFLPENYIPRDRKKAWKQTLRFYAPLYASQSMEVYRDMGTGQMTGVVGENGRQSLLWKMDEIRNDLVAEDDVED